MMEQSNLNTFENEENNELVLVKLLQKAYHSHELHKMCPLVREATETELQHACLYLVSKLAACEWAYEDLRNNYHQIDAHYKLCLSRLLDVELDLVENGEDRTPSRGRSLSRSNSDF